MWMQLLKRIRLGLFMLRDFPCCLIEHSVACDVSEVLWPDKEQKNDSDFTYESLLKSVVIPNVGINNNAPIV